MAKKIIRKFDGSSVEGVERFCAENGHIWLPSNLYSEVAYCSACGKTINIADKEIANENVIRAGEDYLQKSRDIWTLRDKGYLLDLLDLSENSIKALGEAEKEK
jgi:hypothetical protein